ncbi:retrotransposon protein, putative, ty1-copia subclass [Tanacetum coccineum]
MVVDYGETFSPVADIRAIRILLAITAFYEYEIWQMDVKTTFMNGHLSKDVYMVQPKGFMDPKYPNKVCKLQCFIYGLKQASRSGNKRFNVEIKKFRFTQNPDEPCVNLKASGSNVAFLILYVDDILLMGNNVTMLQEVKSWLCVGSTSGIRACALRNFDLGVMELENTQNNALAKLPMLKLGEYEMWEIRIKQYFQIQDYALWEVIENGNSWVPIPVTATETGPSTGLKMTVPSTAEEKICKKNDVKARSLLLMALPNEHQLTFDQYVDAQSMFAAIKARLGEMKQQRRHRALLKQYICLSIQSTTKCPQLVHEDLEQLHDDDLEEIDLKWNMALLSMRARKFYQRTRRKIIIDGSNTTGYDKSKVECFNCHKWDILQRNAEHHGAKTT